jgi:hypothetical protein
MASTTLSALTATISGATITAKTGVGNGQTLTVQCTTAQSQLNFANLHIRCTNTSTTASVSLSLGVGTQFSDKGIGAATITVATNKSVLIGGHGFEGSRFLTSSGTIVFTQTGTGPTSWEAYCSPTARE